MNKNLLKSMLVAAGMTASMGAMAQAIGDIVTVGGSEYQVVGANIITNGSFEDGVNGWYSGAWNAASASNYTLQSEGGFDGGAYLQYSAGGVGADTNIRGKWSVENGKTYLFRCYTSGSAPSSNNLQYSALKIYDESLANYEGNTLYQLVWGAADVWTVNNFVFTAAYDMVTFRSSWTSNAKLDGFAIVEVERYYSPEGYNNAMAAAQEALANEEYANVTGEERTALSAVIAQYTGATSDKYEEAINALSAATNTFKAAKASYDALVTANAYIVDLPYANAAKKPAVATANTAAEAAANASSQLVLIRAYYESNAKAEGVEGAVDRSDAIANRDATDGNNSWTWTGNKNEPRNTESWTDSEGKNDYMYFDGGNWGGTGWTTTMEQTITVPAGKYLLTAKGRASDGVTLTMSVGEASVTLPNVNASGNLFDRGWNDGSVEFTNAEGGDVTILVRATTEGNHQWFSVGDFRLVQLEAITVPMADATDYAALATAITTAEANTLGFDAAEYAPYNNVEALEALAAAKKINPEAEEGNTKSVVEEATAALNAAVWTANTEELNAIYDGQFANTEANATSGDINLPGWTKVQGIRLLVKDVATDPGLAYTEGKAAVFAWGGTTLTYGEQAGYTLPLDTDKPYLLKIKVTGWRDGDYANVFSVTLGDAETQTVDPQIPGRINDAEGNPFVDLKFAFKVTEAQPVLKIYANHHFAIADLELMTTTEQEYDVVTGVSTVNTAAVNSTAIYNLAGQQVKSTQKGLYIQNGRKYIVK